MARDPWDDDVALPASGESDDENDWCPPSRRRGRSSKGRLTGGGNRSRERRRGIGDAFSRFLSQMEWYDYIMIPVLVILALVVVFAFDNVMQLYVLLTMRLIDLGFVLLVILIIVLVLMFIFGRPRRY